MNIINTMGARLPALVFGLAKQKAVALQRTIKLRPFKKVLTYTTDATQDLYIIIIQLNQNPAFDRAIIVNGNEFRVTNAVNEVLGDGSAYPTVTWKGGIPPFVIELQHRKPAGDFLNSGITGMIVNINRNLTDGTGDIVTASAAREYIVRKAIDVDPWWADDLDTDDLGFDEQVNTQKRQNAIGISIKDSATPPRSIFAPFAPDPVYEADGATPSGLFAKYPEGRFGPPTWCVPLIHWDQPAAIAYGTALHIGAQLAALVHIPGTATHLPGELNYWLDDGHSIPAVDTVPDANSGLPLYATFQATDTQHYHLAEEVQGIVVNKANQEIIATKDTAVSGQVGSVGYYAAKARSLFRGVMADNGLSVTLYSSNTSVLSISGDVNNAATGATVTFVGAGKAHIYTVQAGDSNHNPAPDLVGGTHDVSFGMNVPGQVQFHLGSNAITYGERLEYGVNAPILGLSPDFIIPNPTVASYTDPAIPDYTDSGWIVRASTTDITANMPAGIPFGWYFETQETSGFVGSYTITALFYPTDAANYPSPMEYEQFLTVNKNIPVLVWSTPGSFVYGMKWRELLTDFWFNSHHSGDENWMVAGSFEYSITGHSNSAWNGVISDYDAVPDVDSGLAIVCQFTPTGTQAHNYEKPPPTEPRDHGFSITPKNIVIVVPNANKFYGEPDPPFPYTADGVQGPLSGAIGSFVRDEGEDTNAYPIRIGGFYLGGNYNILYYGGYLLIHRATPVVTWNAPASISYGTTITATVSPDVPGKWIFNCGTNNVSDATVNNSYIPKVTLGEVAAIAIFTPDDTRNYEGGWDGGFLTVTQAAQSIGPLMVSGNIVTADGGGTGSVTPTTSSAGLPVVFTASSGNVAVAGNLLSCLVPGTYTIYGNQAGNENYPAAAQVSTVITVKAAVVPVYFEIANGTWINSRLNFRGGSGAYTVYSDGDLTNMAIAVDASPTSSHRIEVMSVGGGMCYQKGGWVKIIETGNPSNTAVKYFADWLPLISASPRIAECATGGSATPPGEGSTGGGSGTWHTAGYSCEFIFPTINCLKQGGSLGELEPNCEYFANPSGGGTWYASSSADGLLNVTSLYNSGKEVRMLHVYKNFTLGHGSLATFNATYGTNITKFDLGYWFEHDENLIHIGPCFIWY